MEVKKDKIKIKAAVFDMDGTMFDTEYLFNLSWLRAAKERNSPLGEEFVERIVGVSKAQSRALAYSLYGDQNDYDEVSALSHKYFGEYVETYGIPLKKGLFELLDFLKNREIPLALATSTGRKSALSHLERTGTLKYFSAFAFGDDIVRSKPDPEIFLLAAERLGADIKDCVVFEDSPNGIKAARASGAKVVCVPDRIPIEGELINCADFILPSLYEAINILE